MSISDLPEIMKLFSYGMMFGMILSGIPYILGLGINTLFKIMKS